MAKKRKIITGIGIMSPVGCGKEAFWRGVSEAKINFSPVSLFSTDGLKVTRAGEIAGFDPAAYLGPVRLRDWDRASYLLACSARQALDDAAISTDNGAAADVGVSVGTTFGSLYSISEFDKEALRDGPRFANPSVFPSTTGNSPASHSSILFGLKRFNATVSTGMCAALDALMYARDVMDLDRAQTVVCGSVEALSEQLFLGFYKLNYMAGTREGTEAVSCPFDRRRNGIVLSEGSAAFILENDTPQRSSGGAAYARVLGIGSSFDPGKIYNYNAAGEGMKNAMQDALADAGMDSSGIDCIYANANSTRAADVIETRAIKHVFGQNAGRIPVTALKSITGETYSSSGGIALAAAIGSLCNGWIPQTANLVQRDEECDLDYTGAGLRRQKVDTVMVNAFSPHGANTCVILGKA